MVACSGCHAPGSLRAALAAPVRRPVCSSCQFCGTRNVRVQYATAERPQTAESAKDPFADITEYKDDWKANLMLSFITFKIARELGDKPQKSGYDGFVEASEMIMRGRTPQEQKEVILRSLASTLPAFFPAFLRAYFRPTEFTCWFNAYCASIAFKWLVGEMEIQTAEITLPDGTKKLQNSQVLIKKCRYLEQSGCKGMCINMCKMPVQEFITDYLGMPLYMEPNFDDLSCKMIFGQRPPPLAEDPVSKEACFSRCSLMNADIHRDSCLSTAAEMSD